MDFLGNKYYKLHRYHLLLIGLWPYANSAFKHCQMVLCNVIVIFTMVCQIMKLKLLRRNFDLMVRIFPAVMVCVIYAIKYQTFYVIAEKIRFLMDHVKNDWNMLKNKNELEILAKYTYVGSMYTLIITTIAYVAILIGIFVPLIPRILDAVAPLNASRPQQLLFPGEYFVDQQKYFYVIWLHIDITLLLIIFTLVGTETLFIMYVQHACGMFQVASYRMAQAFDNESFEAYIPQGKMIVCKRIIEAIQIHKRVLEFSEFLWSSLAMSYSILLIIGITSLIINLFCLFQAVLLTKETNEILRLVLFVLGHLIYLFMGNYIGQILIDHSISIFEKTYITRWHNAPVQAQKLLPIIMQRSIRSCKMVVGGMFVPSFEGFATLMSTTVSYFTVLWSLQK